MEYDDDLKPIKNDSNNDDGNDRNNVGTGTGNGDSSGSSNVGTSGNGGVVGSIGTGETGDGRSGNEGGNPAPENGNVRSSGGAPDGNAAGNRRRTASNRSNRSGSAQSNGGKGAEKEASSDSGGVPRPVEFRQLRGGNKTSAADVALSSQFVGEVWGILFHAAAIATQDEEWKLDEGDAGELSARTIKLLKSLDAKNAAKLEKKIAKVAPSLSLAIALIGVVGPRVAHTRSKKRAQNVQKAATNGARPVGATATSPATSAPEVSRNDRFTPAPNAVGEPSTNGTAPLSRADMRREFGDDHAGEL